MSSFLFLHFCDDALRLLGLYFSAFYPFKTFLRWFLPLPSKPPQGPHTPPTGPVWGFAGVVSLPWAQTATQGQTGPSLRFLSKIEFTPPPKGGGAGFYSIWGCSVCWTRSQLPHTAPTVRGTGFAGVVPILPSKPHTGPHRAEFGVTSFSWGASALVGMPSPAPACNSPPLG